MLLDSSNCFCSPTSPPFPGCWNLVAFVRTAVWSSADGALSDREMIHLPAHQISSDILTDLRDNTASRSEWGQAY